MDRWRFRWCSHSHAGTPAACSSPRARRRPGGRCSPLLPCSIPRSLLTQFALLRAQTRLPCTNTSATAATAAAAAADGRNEKAKDRHSSRTPAPRTGSVRGQLSRGNASLDRTERRSHVSAIVARGRAAPQAATRQITPTSCASFAQLLDSSEVTRACASAPTAADRCARALLKIECGHRSRSLRARIVNMS